MFDYVYPPIKALLLAGLLGLGCFLCTQFSAQAQVSSELEDFWDGVQANANVTGPQADIGQQGGYFTAGSLVYRAPQKNLQLVTARAPTIRAGCGGIDMYAGAFGFVDADQFIAMLKSIASNAQGYAFQLALQTVCDQCAEVMDKMNALAQKVNAMNINSCEAAEALVHSAIGEHERSQRLACETVGSFKGIFSDQSEAVAECSNAGQANAAAEADSDIAAKSIMNKNRAWEVASTLPYVTSGTADGRAYAEFLITLTGTYIARVEGSDGAEPEFLVFPPLGDSDRIFEGLMLGADAQPMEIYTCQAWDGHPVTRCLDMTRSTVTIDADAAMLPRSRQMLDGILDKIETRTALLDEERAFLNSSSLPVFRILSVSYSYSPTAARAEVPGLAEVIAVELTAQFISDALAEIRRGQSTFEQHAPKEDFDRWRTRIRALEDRVWQEQQAVREKATSLQEIVNKYRILEEHLAKRMAVRMSRDWAGSRRRGT